MSFPRDHTKGAPCMVNAAELLDRATKRIDLGRKFAAPDAELSYSAMTRTPDGRRWRVTIAPIAAS